MILLYFCFISNTFIGNPRLKFWNWQKIKSLLSKTLRLNFYCLNIIHTLNARYHSQNDRTYFKKLAKCVCVHDIIRLIIMKMKMKINHIVNRYDINRHILVLAVSMMILICIKQHLSNIWNSIHEKVKRQWGWVEKAHRL